VNWMIYCGDWSDCFTSFNTTGIGIDVGLSASIFIRQSSFSMLGCFVANNT